MVMVVADPILETSRRSRWLDAANETLGDQDAERVIDSLERDRADSGPDDGGHRVRGDVGLRGNRPQYGQSLRGHLDAALPEKFRWVHGNGPTIDQILE
jgi:hypothetical protein